MDKGIQSNNSRVEFGKIINTHGIKGYIKILPWCDDISEYFSLEYFFIENKKFYIESVTEHKKNALVKLKGIEDINNAELLKGKIVEVERSQLEPLPEGTYYVNDLLNFNVKEENGSPLGILVDIFPTGSNDVYDVLTDEGRHILIPAIKDAVINIDTDTKCITVRILEGLL